MAGLSPPWLHRHMLNKLTKYFTAKVLVSWYCGQHITCWKLENSTYFIFFFVNTKFKILFLWLNFAFSIKTTKLIIAWFTSTRDMGWCQNYFYVIAGEGLFPKACWQNIQMNFHFSAQFSIILSTYICRYQLLVDEADERHNQ